MFKEYQVIWLTGQPGAGKTSIGCKIQAYMQAHEGKKAILLDGDDIRLLFENSDYSVSGRRKNIEFVQKMVDFLVRNEIIPIVCLVSPFKDLREETKRNYKTLELYLNCTEIRGREHFHVDYYEPPTTNFISLDTTEKTEEETFKILLSKLS
ncbi:MAG TPA: adenylyl-sulfate kinase [Crocinitomicaceae bacterium]|nr:adenylyl-sulfate kinase [Crocinitomicaceae bacterium]